MKLLAIDTSTEACSAAILVEESVISHYELAPRQHNKIILKMIEALLAEAGLCLQQLDGLAFGQGPGSFTGVRISAGIIQGMALGLDLLVAPVSTLGCMAHRVYREYHAQSVLIAIDARMHEVYWGEFEVLGLGDVRECCAPRVCAPNRIMRSDRDSMVPWVGAGTGWGTYGDILSESLARAPQTIYPEFFPHSHDIALMGEAQFKHKMAVPVEQAMPTYLRDNVAKKSQ